MRPFVSARLARTGLSLEALESRLAPAGIITASLVNGLLTLTGDDADNVITSIQFASGSTIITPNATTTIDDLGVAGPGTVNTPVTITGTVTSLKAALKGGNDNITSDTTTAISLSRGIAIDLGDGNNVFNFTTSAKIDLASMSIKASDGNDTLTIRGGAGLGSQVVGLATLASGLGDSTTTLRDMAFLGSAGVTLSGSGGTQSVTVTNVTVTKLLTGAFGDSIGDLTITTSSLGGMKETAASSTATLTTVTVNGPVTLAGVVTASLTTNPATVNGTVDASVSNPNGAASVTWKGVGTATSIKVHGGQSTLTVGSAATDSLIVTGPVSVAAFRNATMTESKGTMTTTGVTISSTTGTGTATVSGTSLTVTGPITVTSLQAANVTANAGTATTANGVTAISKARSATITAKGTSFTVNGNMTATGYLNATVDETAGTLTANNIKVSAGDTAGVTPAGTSLTVNGNLQATGKLATNVTFGTTALSEVKGKIAITGGADDDTFTASSKFKADQSMSLKLGNGVNSVSIGDKSGVAGVVGDLSISAGVGADTIILRQVAVAGKASILTGAGADVLTIDDGAIFSSKFTADLGGGDDKINIAQDTAAQGSPGPVLFNGLTVFLGNGGNDTLLLGKATGAPGGDSKSAAQFAAGSVLDGGLGLNVFDPTTAQTSGQTIKNWP